MKIKEIVIVATLLTVVWWVLARSGQSGQTIGLPADKPVYFYGKDCAHCKNVQQFLDKNSAKIKFSFEKIEASENQEKILAAAAKCKIEGIIGVPLVFYKNKCYKGELEVENFFQSRFSNKP